MSRQRFDQLIKELEVLRDDLNGKRAAFRASLEVLNDSILEKQNEIHQIMETFYAGDDDEVCREMENIVEVTMDGIEMSGYGELREFVQWDSSWC